MQREWEFMEHHLFQYLKSAKRQEKNVDKTPGIMEMDIKNCYTLWWQSILQADGWQIPVPLIDCLKL